MGFDCVTSWFEREKRLCNKATKRALRMLFYKDYVIGPT